MILLGDIQADLLRLFSLLPGSAGSTAATKFQELLTLIRTEAEKGAMQAVPMIKVEVKKQVTPLIVAPIALGGLALVLSIIALRRAKRRS